MNDGYFCKSCGKFHSGLPFSYGTDSPDNYVNLNEQEKIQRSILGSDQCVIDNKEFYIRGLVELPIIGFKEKFLWGVWASVWKSAYDEISESWNTVGRERMTGPHKGRLANSLEIYPQTGNLKCTIRLQPVGQRPLIFIDEPNHPLAIEQRIGISLERVQEIASKLNRH
jgi:hypothetical protein